MSQRFRLVAVCGLAVASQACGQSAQRAAFVANNGNVEGSVTAFTFDAAGAPVFVGKYITGSGSGNPGNNAYAIALTPSGRYLITTHATAATIERITLFRVNADATLTQLNTFQTPDSPLAAAWIMDTLLAVTLTNTSAPNKVILYRFDEPTQMLTEVDRDDSGGFTGYLAVHPSRQFLYAQDSPLSSGSYTVRTFAVDSAAGTLTDIGVAFSNPAYCLGLSVTPDGRRVYGGGGIAGGGNLITGMDVQADGTLASSPFGPWISPGSSPSPKQAVATPDGDLLFVGHGSSSVVRSFAIDQATGALTDTGFFYDVGIQGDLGGIATLGNLVLFTRKYSGSAGPTGLMSYTVQPDGNFTANGPVVSTQGSLPQYIAAWDPPGPACYANCDSSTTAPVLNVADFTCFLQRFAAADTYANCDQSTTAPVLNVADFTCFLQRFAGGCQ